MKEILFSLILAFIFFIIIRHRNLCVVKPSEERMSNADYQADDINDIKF